MKVKAVPSSWIQTEGRRLDVGPFLFGAVEARERIRRLDAPKQPLKALTAGPGGGIFNGPQFSRLYVTDPAHGVPFLGSSSMLLADLSHLPLLSRKYADSPKLRHLEVQPGMTLISCSGTIGRMVYARPDMAGMWASQDIMKVCPDPARIPPGYLYAFLSSRFGVPMVVGGTYGAIIQHIEPEHIAELPVPRLGDALELGVDSVVSVASSQLAEAARLLDQATVDVLRVGDFSSALPDNWSRDRRDIGFEIRSNDLTTLRAWNHSMRVAHLKAAIKSGNHCLLGDVIDLSWLRWRVMFKRFQVAPEFGIEVLTQKPLFYLMPEGQWISRHYLLSHSERYVVPDQTTLIAKQGTLGEREVYCRVEFITGQSMLERAYSDHCMRVVARAGAIDPGYLFAFLRSEVGFRILRAYSEGGKQQDLHWRTLPHMPIPRQGVEREGCIGDAVREAYRLRNAAVDAYKGSQQAVERMIQGGV